VSFQNLFNPDFLDFIRALNTTKVEYILVGGYAVNLHGYFRGTGDMDIWVKPTRTNYARLVNAFNLFGLSLFDMSEANFLDTRVHDVFTFGRPPVSIDIMTKVRGLDFEHALSGSVEFEVGNNIRVRTIGLADLIKAKQSSGRHKDLDDIAHLTDGEGF